MKKFLQICLSLILISGSSVAMCYGDECSDIWEEIKKEDSLCAWVDNGDPLKPHCLKAATLRVKASKVCSFKRYWQAGEGEEV